MRTYLGIDPGQSGGIAWWTETEDGPKCFAIAMPKTERDILEMVRGAEAVTHAAIEKVHAMPGQGVSSTFKFGQSYGTLRMALVASEVPFEEVTPGVWQKPYGLVRRSWKSKVEKKNAAKARAQELAPNLKVTHATADAILIAHWCFSRWGKVPPGEAEPQGVSACPPDGERLGSD